MSTTENLRKDDVIEVRELHLAAGGLSSDELATVTGGGSIRIHDSASRGQAVAQSVPASSANKPSAMSVKRVRFSLITTFSSS